MKKGYVPELRFPEFRNDAEWDVATVGSKAIKVGSGITPKGGDKNYKKSGRPFIRSQNIGWGHLILDDVAFIDDDTHSTFSSTEIKANDVLLNITGASIGRSAVADSDIQGGNVNQHVCIIRTKKSELKPYFLNQYLLSSDGQKQIDSFQAGGNRQGLNFAQIRSFSFLLPSVKEQQKIADCLSSLDSVISLQMQKIDALQQYKKGLMQKLFPAEGETVPELRFSEFQNNAIWEEKNIGSMCRTFSGGTPLSKNKEYYGGDIPFIRSGEINEYKTDLYLTKSGLERSSAKLVEKGDVLIALYGANSGDVSLAKINGAINQAILCLKSTQSHEFIYHFLSHKKDYFVGLYLQGGQGNLSGEIIKSIKLCFPAREEQQKIANCLSSLDERITAETQKLTTLKTHKTGLMQQLFPEMDEVNG